MAATSVTTIKLKNNGENEYNKKQNATGSVSDCCLFSAGTINDKKKNGLIDILDAT